MIHAFKMAIYPNKKLYSFMGYSASLRRAMINAVNEGVEFAWRNAQNRGIFSLAKRILKDVQHLQRHPL